MSEFNGCIGVVKRGWVGDGCGRGASVTDADLFRGRQPLCWQHHDLIDKDLQRWALGLDKLIVPNAEQIAGLREQPCSALLPTGERCSAAPVWFEVYGGQPLSVPLCLAHVISLAWALRAEFNDRAPQGVKWGWQVARDYDLAAP